MKDKPIFTVKGKGGRYIVTNTVIGAGTLKGSNYTTYRCLSTGREFVRSTEDFLERMEQVTDEVIPEDSFQDYDTDPAALSTKYIVIILVFLGLFALIARLPDEAFTF